MLIELGPKSLAKNYIIMPVYRALPTALLLLASLFMSGSVQADDLKDIAQQASQGQQAAALERINAYLSANPKDVQAMFIRGVILAEQNRRDEAIKVFSDITEKYPNLPEPYNNLAVLYADQGQYDKARKALETAIKTHPSYATAHENLGDIYARMASEAYDKALQLDNGNTRARGKLSLIKDLFSSTGKPILLANKPAEISKSPETSKDKPKLPALPSAPAIRPAEPSKSVEPIKPSEAKPAAPIKSTEPKASEPVKLAEAPKPVDSKADSGKTAATNADSDDKDITASVNSWAKAWSSKNVDKYLASYADSFQTPGGESRKDWEESRRGRINAPASINVEVTDLRIKMEDSSHAKVNFRQSYRAGSIAKRTAKVLIMRKTNGKWLIEQELTDR